MKTLPFFLFILGVSTLSFEGLLPQAFAGTITKNTDKKIIIDFKGETVPAPKAQVVVLDQESHKEIGLIEIIKTKDSRALGKLIRGAAKPGDTTDIAANAKSEEERLPAEESSSVPSSTPARKKKKTKSRISYGLGGNFIYTSVLLKTADQSGSLDGNGFGVRGALEYPLTHEWIILASAGLHSLNMTSNATGISSIATNYLGIDGVVRYAFDKRSEGLWIGGGLGYYLTMSSNISPKPSNEFVFMGSAGYNIRLSRDYFTLKSDFLMFPSKSSNGVSYQFFQIVLGGIYFF